MRPVIPRIGRKKVVFYIVYIQYIYTYILYFYRPIVEIEKKKGSGNQ